MATKTEATRIFYHVKEEDIKIDSDVRMSDVSVRSNVKESAYYKALVKLEGGQSFSFPSLVGTTMGYAIELLKKEMPERKYKIRTISETHKRVFRVA